MNKDDIIKKLSELGIITANCFPKSSFMKGGEPCIGLFKRETLDDFYFFNTFDKKIYVFKKVENILMYDVDTFMGNTKYIVPLSECSLVWEDKEYVELPDDPYNTMTLRDYACIQLKYPGSTKEWLNTLIKEASTHHTIFKNITK